MAEKLKTQETRNFYVFNHKILFWLATGLVLSSPVINLYFQRIPIPANFTTLIGPILLTLGLILLIKDRWIWKKYIEIANYKKVGDGRVLLEIANSATLSASTYTFVHSADGRVLLEINSQSVKASASRYTFTNSATEEKPRENTEEPIDEDTYQIFQSISEILGIDRAKGSLCITELTAKEYLADATRLKVMEFETEKMKVPRMTDEQELAFRKQLFNGFNPSLPIFCTLNYPLSHEVTFEIKPYEYTSRDLTFKFFPVGYVAWSIAKKYEEIYQDPEEYGIWGHRINDLVLRRFTLIDNVTLKVEVVGSN
jgi:hypothetical protein